MLVGAQTSDYGARSKVSWDDRNLFTTLLSVGNCHGLATLYGMKTSARASCKAFLKADVIRGSNV